MLKLTFGMNLTMDGYIAAQARRREPKRRHLRLFSIPAQHARTGRRRLLSLAATAPALQALAHLNLLRVLFVGQDKE